MLLSLLGRWMFPSTSARRPHVAKVWLGRCTKAALTLLLLGTAPLLAEDSPTSNPTTAPSTQPTKLQIQITKTEDYYAKIYGEPLTSPDRLPREIAIISLSRIDAQPTTQKLLDVFKGRDVDPVVYYLAWEALHPRSDSLTKDERRRWATGGLAAATAGGFPGITVTPLLRALAEHHPIAYENQPYKLAARVIEENSLEDSVQKETLTALRDLVAAWHDPSLVKAIIALINKPGLTARVEYVLHSLPGAPQSADGAGWQAWLDQSKMKVATPEELKPYKSNAVIFPTVPKMTDPNDPRWRAELEIGKLTVTDFDLAWCIDSTGSMNETNQMVASQTELVMRIFSFVSRRARCGALYARHEVDPTYMKECCNDAANHSGWYTIRPYALTTDVKALAAKMMAEKIPKPDAKKEGNMHPGTPVLGAMQVAVKAMQWSRDKNARKVIVLVGDAKPTPGTEQAAEKFAATCKTNGYSLHALTEDKATDFWTDILKAGGGSIVPMKGGKEGGHKHHEGRNAGSLPLNEPAPHSAFTDLAATIIKESVTPPYRDRADPLVEILTKCALAAEQAERTMAGKAGR